MNDEWQIANVVSKRDIHCLKFESGWQVEKRAANVQQKTKTAEKKNPKQNEKREKDDTNSFKHCPQTKTNFYLLHVF